MLNIIVSAKYLYLCAVWRRPSERKNCMMLAKMIGKTIKEMAVFGSIKIVNRNVSREPNFRYTTILLKKINENDRKN